ncbi:F-box/LRR-repeat protein 2 [Nematostella vectensis]|uniref:F-box/LRR-repeat protein 2 n=1 Tax=Nematostella vectensis TaxID=45351 RepID=UPI0020770669|nr:F-box/LRR-repeat protein 2 [Nematostella vectensis]
MKMEKKKDTFNTLPASCQLPQEVVSYIFSFLPLADIKSSARVCHLWAKASDDPLLWKNTTATLYTKSKTFPDSLIYSLQCRCIKSIRFVHTTTPVQIIQVCKELADSVQSLSLQNCRCVNEDLLDRVFACCTKLTDLDVSRCRQLDASKTSSWIGKSQQCLTSLSKLDISWCKGLGDSAVKTVATALPSISHLSLAGCKEVHLSSWQSLGKNLKSLSFLDISRSDITDVILLKFAEVPTLSLRSIDLSACKQLTDNGVVSLVKNQSKIETLKLCCLDITNTSVIAFGKYLNNLKELDLNSCRQVMGGAFLSSGGIISTLTSLNLYSCYLLASKEMEKFFIPDSKSSVLPLQTLILNGCTMATDNFLKRCLPAMVNLQQLDISSCLHVGDSGMHVITELLTNLKMLKISWCANITDVGLLGSGQLSNCDDKIIKENLAEGNGRPSENKKCNMWEDVKEVWQRGIGHLHKLEFLDVSHCTCITDKGLCAIYGLSDLLTLNINMCIEVTDATLVNVSRHLRSLRELSFNGCSLVTDTGVIAIAQGLSQLQTLDASKCDGVSDLSVFHLAKHSSRLTHLDLSMCSHVTSNGVDELEAYLPGLVSLQLRHSGVKTF